MNQSLSIFYVIDIKVYNGKTMRNSAIFSLFIKLITKGKADKWQAITIQWIRTIMKNCAMAS
jgi:hypothetical protein